MELRDAVAMQYFVRVMTNGNFKADPGEYSHAVFEEAQRAFIFGDIFCKAGPAIEDVEIKTKSKEIPRRQETKLNKPSRKGE
ncbi:MAG: hypothetical protein FVQ84_08350 [Planctomycetes bacterium]|nr:hypothetical protein [Planctomycetota bacterium]